MAVCLVGGIMYSAQHQVLIRRSKSGPPLPHIRFRGPTCLSAPHASLEFISDWDSLHESFSPTSEHSLKTQHGRQNQHRLATPHSLLVTHGILSYQEEICIISIASQNFWTSHPPSDLTPIYRPPDRSTSA